MSVSISGGSSAGGLTPYQINTLISDAVSGAALNTTDDLAEGTQHLYYTDTRVGEYLALNPAAQGATGAQGTQGLIGASGVSSSYYNYKIDANSQENTQPATGYFRYNNSNQKTLPLSISTT